MKSLFFAFFITASPLYGQQLFCYNQSDTLVEKITTPFFVSQKLVWFDSSYVEKHQFGSSFKIGKVCAQFGCDGEFLTTGKVQAGWWLLENKIVICYLTPITSSEFKSELKVWRYNHKTGRFTLIL